MDKRPLSQPAFDVPTVEVDDHVETAEGHLNMSGDSAISSTSGVSSTFDLPADIVRCIGYWSLV